MTSKLGEDSDRARESGRLARGEREEEEENEEEKQGESYPLCQSCRKRASSDPHAVDEDRRVALLHQHPHSIAPRPMQRSATALLPGSGFLAARRSTLQRWSGRAIQAVHMRALHATHGMPMGRDGIQARDANLEAAASGAVLIDDPLGIAPLGPADRRLQ